MKIKKMKTSTKLRLKAIGIGTAILLTAPIMGPVCFLMMGASWIVNNKDYSRGLAKNKDEENKVFEEDFDKMVKDFEKKHEENKEN